MSTLDRRLERLERDLGPVPDMLVVDRTSDGRFIDNNTGKVYGTADEVVAAKGLDRERTMVVSWEG